MTIVGDVMARDLLTVEQETTLVDAAAEMTIGIVSIRDLMRVVLDDVSPRGV